MKKVVLIPDSFKGSLSSEQICALIAQRVAEHFPQCEAVSIPVADGGEGSVDCYLAALGGKKVPVTVTGPFFETVDAFYGVLPDGETAVIEMASCAGLPQAQGRLNPMITTTYGVGQLILAAAEAGCKKIILGLGGSCTNDAGTGAAAAVGIRFYNKFGMAFVPTGGTLSEIARIDTTQKSPVLGGVTIVAMCDIDNPMYGPAGAARVFAPQKGADADMVQKLDSGLAYLAAVIEKELGVSVRKLPGGGAAGAMGAGMVAFFGAQLQMGIETVLDTVAFDHIIKDADLIFTGEGRIDAQSLRGKVIAGVAKRAKKQGVPVIALVGDAETDIGAMYEMGVTAVFPINRKAKDFSQIKHLSGEYLSFTADDVLRLLKAVMNK